MRVKIQYPFSLSSLLKIEHKFNSKTPILFFGSHYIAKDVFDAFEFSFDSGII